MPGFSARNCQILVGGQALTATRLTITGRAEEHDITNFDSVSGTTLFHEVTLGKVECDLQVEAWWNSSQNPHGNPPGIWPGAQYRNVKVILDRQHANANTQRTFEFPKMAITEVVVEAEVRGLVKYTFTAKASLSFNYPGIITPDNTTSTS